MSGQWRTGGLALIHGLAVAGILSCVPSEPGEKEKPPVVEEAAEVMVTRDLPLGRTEPGHFPDGHEVHHYTVDLEVGDYLYVEVEQRGVDLAVSLVDADGRERIGLDSPGGAFSTERFGFVAQQAGRFSVVLEPSDTLEQRRYAIRAAEPRPAKSRDLEYAQACRDLSTADSLRAERSDPALRHAVVLYRRLRETWHALGETSQEIISRNREAQVWERLRRSDLARERYEQALAFMDRAKEAEKSSREHSAHRIDLLLRTAQAERRAARTDAAVEADWEARQLAHRIGDRQNEGTALQSLASLSSRRGRNEEALRHSREAARIYREMGYLLGLTHSLRTVGDTYVVLGRPQEALKAYREAMKTGRESGNVRALVRALNGLGWYYYSQDQFDRALEIYEETVRTARDHDEPVFVANALDRRGSVYRALGRLDEALGSYTEALRIYEDYGDRQSQGPVLVNLGHLYLERGLPDRALEQLRTALPRVREVEDRSGEADALLLMARAERRLGRLDAAQTHGAAALDVLESIRADVADPDDRTLFLAIPRQKFYEFNVELAMEQASRTGQESYEALAFATAERNRARVLAELLGQARKEGRSRPLDLEEARGLVDSGTVVLAFFFGDRQSFLWRIDQAGIDTCLLPPRARVEKTARDLHESLKEGHDVAAQGPIQLHLENLSRMILAQVDGSLDRERLVIVADGALHYVPFAALPKPSTGEPLVVDHEIVTLPSLSLLGALRKEESKPSELWRIAAVADPVTARSDERLPESGDAREALGSPGEHPRLASSQAEVREILSLLPDERAFSAVGFDADLDLVRSGVLGGYDVVHFAVHSILDAGEPENSSIVLSLFDREGRPKAGLLRLAEVYDLELDAELVVLSACSTALGRQVHGEGLIGLTRGFMSAGASRVVVSLWNVSDRATAQLMTRFYRAMLTDGQGPAQALRTAQKSMLADPVFRAPYYWAPFLFQGDWR